MLRYVAPSYEERSYRLARVGGSRRRAFGGVAHTRTDARSPIDRRPRVLARRIASGLDRHRSAQRIVAGTRAVAARRCERSVAPAHVLGQERRLAAMVAGWDIDCVHVGSRRRSAALSAAAPWRRSGKAHGP